MRASSKTDKDLVSLVGHWVSDAWIIRMPDTLQVNMKYLLNEESLNPLLTKNQGETSDKYSGS